MRQNTLFGHPGGPARALGLALGLALAVLLVRPAPAAAQAGMDELQRCLCVNVAARILCKDTTDFDYVTTDRDGTHAFTVFYANKDCQVRCFVSESFVHIKAELKRIEYHSVPYSLDPSTMCARVELVVPQCPARWPMECCAEKSADELQEEKALEFWSRPVPELLREELESGIAREQNATEPESEAEPGR